MALSSLKPSFILLMITMAHVCLGKESSLLTMMSVKYCDDSEMVMEKAEISPIKFLKFNRHLGEFVDVPTLIHLVCKTIDCSGIMFKVQNCDSKFMCYHGKSCRLVTVDDNDEPDLPPMLFKEDRRRQTQPWWFPNDRIM